MKPTRSRSGPLLVVIAAAAAAAAARAQSTAPADPRLTSWSVAPSGRYARLYETTTAKNAGAAVTTWSRGQGVQSAPTYAGVMQVAYSANWVYVRASGLGYHAMGPWYLNAAQTQNFPNFPANQNVLYRLPRTPTVPATKTLTPAGAIGYGVDGVALFDNRDTFSYNNAAATDASPVNGLRGDGVWNRDAYINEGVTFDPAFAHQAGANYHYHANTPALRHLLGDNVDYNATAKSYAERSATGARHSPILGWLADGHPLYGPYGYATAMDATSAVRRLVPGYQKRDGTNGTTNLTATGRTTLPAWATRAQNRTANLASNLTGPAVSTAYPLGAYLEDYDYVGELGKTQGTDFDLDLYNGRFCVTPEFPNGTYAYFLTIESDGTPKFPYIVGRWYYGSPAGGSVNAITETVTEYVRGGQASAIAVTAVAAASNNVLVSWNSVEGGTYAVASSSDGTNYTTLASGVTSAGLTTTHTSSTVAAYYRVTLTAVATYDTRGTGGLSGVNGHGSAAYSGASTVQTPGATGTARLINLATRAQVGGAAGTPISGFVLGGSPSTGSGQAVVKRMLARAVGPTLTSLGVTGVLADPNLTLVAGGATVATNDNWLAGDAATFTSVGAFALTTGSRDAALVSSLAAGAYSVVVGAGDGSGVTLLELYDADSISSTGATLVNASTRAFVGTGESVLIPGFVISGSGTVKVLLRAAGPALASFGVTGALADPQISLYSSASTTALATNDNWSTATNAAAISAAATSAGAFAFPSGSRDAALLVDLSAGNYTATVSGVGATTGTALVEIYVVQ
ncbi:MAG: YHYH protein [Verrucomicrobia bacterium]|nr:YHYH protein [Verrucomicrobiota bacterium]